MKSIASSFAIAFGIACISLCAPAIAATFSDPAVNRLAAADVNVVILGVKQSGSTIQVKKGDIIEVQFPQLVKDDQVWWFGGINPSPPDFFLVPHFEGPPAVNGQPQAKAPGYMAFKIDAKEVGTYKLVFKHGPAAQDLDQQRFQAPDQTIELTLVVQ